jgi:hypothetical protein
MGAASTQAVDCGGTTGPYRRTYSNEGYSFVSATVFLPSKTDGDISYGVDGDQAYVYTGGWGANGTAVDAGFLHDYGLDQWSLFMRLQGVKQTILLSPDPRLVAGAPVSFSFEVTGGQYVLTATGTRVDGLADPAVLKAAALLDWSSEGTGQVMKRMTSIAQNVPANNGSYLKNVRWSNAEIGVSGAGRSAWAGAETGGHCNHPDQAVVQVNYVDNANETVSIVLPNA